ncbi:MarR family transcriptional regulator [Halovivax gelatinilyticus]|uniref:MarR family transcriptional regulator n=1 Tax=Halovivax gelatinilyticus TaxID=2961597 RepID=UPI0020CA280C|nr:helix-turn-helix domain-containing protein [Halovivax gelatinilyticus]
MSIDIERFEEDDPDAWEEPTNAERVLAFLADHDDRAWKAGEIADRTGISQGSIGPVLVRLREQDLVRHRGSYWAITDDRERLHDATELHRITASLDERFGSEDRSEWIAHAAESTDEGTAERDEG